MQVLLEAVIGVRVPIRHQLDNSQAKLAIERGYSKRLRHLQRTQRVCIGLLHESLHDPELLMSLDHCGTDKMKADVFTKSMTPAKFGELLRTIGLQ